MARGLVEDVPRDVPTEFVSIPRPPPRPGGEAAVPPDKTEPVLMGDVRVLFVISFGLALVGSLPGLAVVLLLLGVEGVAGFAEKGQGLGVLAVLGVALTWFALPRRGLGGIRRAMGLSGSLLAGSLIFMNGAVGGNPDSPGEWATFLFTAILLLPLALVGLALGWVGFAVSGLWALLARQPVPAPEAAHAPRLAAVRDGDEFGIGRR